MSTHNPNNEPTMTPKRPYLLRAFYEWIVDNGLTPHVLVDANYENVVVPRQYVKNGSIVLNISPGAVHSLHMDNDAVTFSARFNGASFSVYLPMPALKAIYARENQQGASFYDSEYGMEEPAKAKESATERLEVVEGHKTEDSNDPTPPRTRPTLRVVK
ncbi:ClpXP protease specificity-enhancing factor [Thiofilum flexile]|uniref:ClpXP protease specificity-enhancing factor n=1 Tax=Thiofilum flexile TaxID=125627 RepID=UPI000594E375|nr:ClpXP protease specificity-enhancing factor [Thiofilum flexile]